MVSSTLKPHRREKRAATPGLTSGVADFQVLGIRPREARVEVIRQAVSKAARQRQQMSSDVLDDPLARIVVAGYRLLDPRRRSHLLERVQLLLWTEEDLSGSGVSWWQASGIAEDAAGSQDAAPRAMATRPQSISSGYSPLDQRLESAVTGNETVRSVVVSSRTEESQAARELVQLLRRHQRQMNGIWIALAVAILGCGIGLAAVSSWL